MGTALERASAVYHIADRACAHEMDSETVDGMDVLVMYDAMQRAVQRGRESQLPTLLEARTYRYMGHSMADPIHGHYRTKEELEEQKKKDPIAGLRHRLRDDGLLEDAQFEAMDTQVHQEVEDALAFAEESPDPEPSELLTDVYKQ
jgi:pyruvate dehydrogenase E1 component alpha subunit